MSHCRNCWLAICAATTFLPHKAGRYFPPKKDRGPEQISFVKGEGHSPNLSILLNQKQVYKGRVGYPKISPCLCSFPGWNWWERLEEKVVLSPFLKKCKPISIQTATSTLFKSRQRLQTCINQYNLVLQIWLPSKISKLTKVLPQPIRQPGYPPSRLHQQRPVEAGHCIYMCKILTPRRMHWNCCKIAYFKSAGIAFRICMTC